MERILAKIRNKKLKGNISLLVILILLASSVISLLSINQIQRLLTYGNMTFNYFRAFYLAKAWTELWLTEVYNSGDGFNHAIPSDDAIVKWNLISAYSGFNPYFNMTISGSFLYLTNDVRESNQCSGGNKIKLSTWAWIMISLFSDETNGISNILSGNKNLRKLEDISDLSLGTVSNDLTFALFVYSGDVEEIEEMEDIVVETGNNLDSFFNSEDVKTLLGNSSIKKYLTIKNSSNDVIEFCIDKHNDLIPYSDSLITVFWHYGDMEVWLQSIVKKWVPDWTLNVIDQPTS